MIWQKKKFTKKPFEIRQKVQGCQQTTRAFILIFFFYNFFFFQFCRSAQVVNKKELLKHGLLNRWTYIFILPWPALGWAFNPTNKCYTNSLNLCKSLRKYLFRHSRGKSMVFFYIVNALGQNLPYSEIVVTGQHL